MTEEEFISEHQGRHPVHFPGEPTKYATLIDSDDINRMLSKTVVGLGTVRIRQPNGRQVALDEFSVPVDINRDRRAIRADVMEGQLKAGATLSIEHCESLFPDLHEMCCTLAEAFMARVYATLFLVYTPERPCGLHWDDRDMFVCQVAGRKHWPLYKPPYENPLLDHRRTSYQTPAYESAQEFTLKPGESLYIPRGWAHNPAAIEEGSMHVAFAIAMPTGIDLLDWIRADLSKTSAEIRGDLPLTLPPSGRSTYANRLREIVLQHLSDETLENYYQRHRSIVCSRPVRLPELEITTGAEDRVPADHTSDVFATVV